MANARTIVCENKVEATVSDLIKEYPRMDDAWEAWKWRLAKDPITDATPVNDNTMIIKSSSLYSDYGVPSITIMYSFSENEVNILSVKLN